MFPYLYLDFQPQVWGSPRSTAHFRPRQLDRFVRLDRLVGVRKAAHAGHDAEHVVVHRIHADLRRAARPDRVDGDRQLQGRLVDTGEVARAGRLVLLRLEREGIHVDADRRGAGVVLVRLHAVEVATLALREPILAVELQLGNLDGVLAGALDTGVEDNLREQVVGRRREDLVALVVTRVEPGRAAQRRAERNTKTRQVGTRRAVARRGGNLPTLGVTGGVTERATREDVHDDALRGEVVGVVERLAAIDLRDEVLVGRAVDERVTLDNPHELLNRVVKVQLDLVGGGRDGLRTRELELLDEVLVGLLGEPAALLRVQVDVVDVQGRRSQGLDGRRRRSRAVPDLVVGAVDPLLELNVDAHLVVLERDERDGEAGVAAEPELQRDVQRLRRGARARRAGVGELRARAGRVQRIAARILHQDEVVRVADHVVERRDGARILGELGPDLHPVAELAVDALAADFKLNDLDEAVADVVEPAEAGKTSSGGREVDRRENNLDVRPVHQVSVTVDDRRDTLVEVRLAVEGDLNGLHGEVGVPLEEHLPEGDLRVAGDVDVLRTIRDELKKTTAHVVVLTGKKKVFGADFTRLNGRCRMVKIAVATQGLILVRTAHNDLYIRVLASITEESRSSIGTLTAECSKPQNTVCERNAVKNLTKLASIGIAIQTHEIHMLAMRIHRPLNERN